MKAMNTVAFDAPKLFAREAEFITVTVAGQLLGLPIGRVHDVFVVSEMTKVPLAQVEIAGLLNLRGRVVTAVSLRSRLGLQDGDSTGRRMAVGLEYQGEAYGLLVDEVGEVLKLNPDEMQPNPVHMDRRWVNLSQGVHQLQGQLMIVLDVDAVLAFVSEREAA
ncbi:chemotaxis protein CheW [Microvirga guangxiensis]|uniref:Purine-binding chemotaxis protein CheW n=1 Tax=Microvirga guangxiensis TaxID=549386 RepID=A0A1G5CX20_9HYPH|nr:chemotaxis protein CheW [Microvirga guangxiensis]SCY06811.1 purine-binding chemotaxis protein CheW [Microvirga guangxiensis]